MIKKQTQIHIANPKNLLYKIMNDHGKSNQELLKELHELRFEHIALKTLCNKELSECMLAEKHFEESEEKYRFMFDDNPQPNWIFDMETLSFVQVNEAAINHYGYSREEFLSMTIKDIRKVEDIPSVLEEIDRTRNSFRNAGERRHIKKNGELIFVEISTRSVLFHGKESCHVLIQDITDRKRSEEALKQANNELVRLHNNLDEAVFSLDVIQNKMLYASIAHQTVFGHSPEEFFKNPLLWYKIIVPEDKPLVDNVFPVLHSGKKHRQEFRIVDSNGEIRWIDAKMNPTLDENGILTRIDGIASDITDRKLSEEALKQANDELVRLHNNLDDAVFSVDQIHNKMLFASIAHQTIFGHSPAEFFENPQLWHEIIVPEDKPIVDAGFLILLTGKKLRQEYRITDTTGKIHWIEVKINPTLDENGILTRIDGIASDITQRKRIEVELLESEINFRRSISESPVGMRIVTMDGNTIYANKAFLDIYEIDSLEEFTNIPSIDRYSPESYIQHQKRKKKRKAGIEVSDYEISIICKNKDIRHVKVSRKEILWNGTKHFQLINLNITEQRNSEKQLRKFASHLLNVREEEKIALAREIHDDLGQILVALKIDVGLLKQKVMKTNSADSEVILPKFENIGLLINDTIKAARRIMNGLRPELLELHGFVGATTEYLRVFEERHHVTGKFICDVPNIEMNPQQALAFFRILQESLSNIAKHAQATSVNIQLTNSTKMLCLEISDNGIGFDKNNSGREDSYGMLGMKERVNLLEGELTITSKLGQGTSVRVEIPYSS